MKAEKWWAMLAAVIIGVVAGNLVTAFIVLQLLGNAFE